MAISPIEKDERPWDLRFVEALQEGSDGKHQQADKRTGLYLSLIHGIMMAVAASVLGDSALFLAAIVLVMVPLQLFKRARKKQTDVKQQRSGARPNPFGS